MAENAQQKQVRMRIQDNNVRASYANALRHNATPNELILDFGLNTVVNHPNAKGTPEDPAADVLFSVENRIVMNYQTAKQLAGALTQLIQAREQQFGEIKIDGGVQG